MQAAALPLMIVSGLAAAGSSIMAGRAKQSAMNSDAAMAEQQARDVDLQAKQSSERRQEDLHASLSALDARRAESSLSLDSPTAIAIEKELRRQSNRDTSVERLGYLNQEQALSMKARADRKGAKTAGLTGFVGAASSLASTGANIAGGK